MRRCYSQLASAGRASGIVKVNEGVISVGANAGSPVAAVPAETRSARQAVVDKVQRSVLFEQLKPHERHHIFRQSHWANPAVTSFGDAKITVDGKEVRPTQYPGPPSVSDLQTIIEAASTPQQLDATLGLMRKFADHKRLQPILRKQHFTAILRRSAELGTFTQVYASLTVDRNRFNPFFDQHFYQEALRIFALRVPYLSLKSKNHFYRLHMRSSLALGRDMCLIYALAAYGNKFGAEHVKRLEPLLASATQDIQKWLAQDVIGAKLNNVDASIGLAGAQAAETLGVTGASELVAALESASQKLSSTQTLHLVESLAKPAEPAEPAESAESVETPEATEAAAKPAKE